MAPKLKWNYIPPPEGLFRSEDHFHVDSDQIASRGFGIFGAKVRGLNHKHEGSHCDDWFEISCNANWDIIVVSDGAGSAALSRVGAREACKTAARFLADSLRSFNWHENQESEKKSQEIKSIVSSSFKAAHQALINKVQELKGRPEIASMLGRDIQLSDLACTLNVAIHSSQSDRSVTIGCQIGDGLIGLVLTDGSSQVLSKSDSGDYAGETRFITSLEQISNADLEGRVSIVYHEIQSLLVMSDGVSSDFFPESESPTRIWAELLVNGVPDFEHIDHCKENPDLSKDLSSDSVYLTENEIVEEAAPRTLVSLRSAARYGEWRQKTESEIVTDRQLAWEAHKGRIIEGKPEKQNVTAGERLRLWLEAFYIKGGSKDDRTLVVLHRKRSDCDDSDKIKLESASTMLDEQHQEPTLNSGLSP